MRRILITGGVVVLTALALGATGCTKKPTEAPKQVENPSISDAKKSYTQALSRAKGWQQNATLSRIYRTYNGTLTPDPPPPVNLAFSSLAEPTHSFVVENMPNGTKEHKDPKQPFEIGLQPVDTSQWQIPPDIALDKAEEDGGGKQFREAHLAGYKVLEQLSQISGHPLQWYFRYDAGDGSQARREVWVNAASGAVENKKDSKA